MKLYDVSNITLDGQLNEAIWADVPEYTDFRLLEAWGGQLAESQTFFKILPCKDRVYFGIKCMELDMDRVRSQPKIKAYHSSSVEVFLSPYGSAMNFTTLFSRLLEERIRASFQKVAEFVRRSILSRAGILWYMTAGITGL